MQSIKTTDFLSKQQSDNHQVRDSVTSSSSGSSQIELDIRGNLIQRDRLYTFKAIPSNHDGPILNQDISKHNAQIGCITAFAELSNKASPGFQAKNKLQGSLSTDQAVQRNIFLLPSQHLRDNAPSESPFFKVESCPADGNRQEFPSSRKFSFQTPQIIANTKAKVSEEMKDLDNNLFLKAEKSVSQSDLSSSVIILRPKQVKHNNEHIKEKYIGDYKDQKSDREDEHSKEPTPLSTIEDAPSELSYTCFMKELKAECKNGKNNKSKRDRTCDNSFTSEHGFTSINPNEASTISKHPYHPKSISKRSKNIKNPLINLQNPKNANFNHQFLKIPCPSQNSPHWLDPRNSNKPTDPCVQMFDTLLQHQTAQFQAMLSSHTMLMEKIIDKL